MGCRFGDALVSGPAIPLLTLLAAFSCGGDPSSPLGGSSGQSETTEVTATTIPIPEPTSTSEATVTSGSSSTGAGTSGSSSGGNETGTGLASTGPQTSSSTGDGTEGSSSSGQTTTNYDVSWCRLQYPPDVSLAPDESFTVYVRLYAAGLTDLSGVNDPAGPQLLVEIGYGLDGSDPWLGVGAPWTWSEATPNQGYGPAAPSYEMNNDEYAGPIAFPRLGVYDYASRISGNGGRSWIYCDLDGWLTGGYTPDQAGHALVEG